MADAKPREFKRFSTRYVESEDRVRLVGKTEDDAAEIVWLTQRLLQRLVSALVQTMEGGGEQDGRREMLQALAQQRARAGLVPRPPVRPGPDTPSWVALTVHLKRQGKRLWLVFEGANDKRIAIAFTPKGIRQWLGILYDNYVGANWPLAVWPEWIRESAAPAQQGPGVLH